MITARIELDKEVLYIFPALLLIIFPAFQISDINLHAFSRNEAADPDISVFTWNSRFWDDGIDESDAIAFLKEQNADVYLIQEFMTRTGKEIDESNVTEAFPEFSVHKTGELLTLSRFEIIERHNNNQDEFLRTDILVENTRVSFYNVHIPVHIFRDGERMEYLHDWRIEEIDKLAADLRENTNPYVVSGDFNTTKSMGLLSKLDSLSFDSINQSREIIPSTWSLFGVNLWRIDYLFTDYDQKIEAVSYQRIDPEGLSDHAGISVGLKI